MCLSCIIKDTVAYSSKIAPMVKQTPPKFGHNLVQKKSRIAGYHVVCGEKSLMTHVYIHA